MKIKLDENLPVALVHLLSGYGHDVDTVEQEGLRGVDDPHVWEATVADDRFFMTQDLDFSDTRQFAPGTHPGILVLRLADPSRRAIEARFRDILKSQNISHWRKCFVVISDKKIRIKSPK